MRVIDSSSLVKFFSREEGWDRVEEVILDGVMSFDLSIKEVVNALWKKVLNEEIGAKDAEEILKDLTKPEVIKTLNQNDYMLGAFKIAVKNKITIYDALFIELAKSTNNELVTSDSKQAEIARKEGVKIKIL
ncbi:MAG: type II toxin-antitoxin system VapC family toxin [Nitrososphaerales archaeon]